MDDLIAVTGAVRDTGNGARNVPSLVVSAGGDAQKRFIEFFAAQIRNRNTGEAYVRAVVDFFDRAEEFEIGDLIDIEPVHVSAWVELKPRGCYPTLLGLSGPNYIIIFPIHNVCFLSILAL